MFNLRNPFKSELCIECRTVKSSGKTDIYNKFRCDDCTLKKEIVIVVPQQPDEILQEQYLEFFDEVYGLDDVKEPLYLVVNARKPVNALIVSPPAGAKTLIANIIRRKCKNVLYFDGSNMSGAGFIETLQQNKNAKIIIIDEIDKMKKNDLSCLLGLLSTGMVDKTLKGKRISFSMDVRVIATSNSTVKLSKPMLSRFMTFILPEYTDEDFVKVIEFCLKNELPSSVCKMIAESLLANNKKDVRAAIGLSALIQPSHSYEDVQRIITSFCKYNNEQVVVDYN